MTSPASLTFADDDKYAKPMRSMTTQNTFSKCTDTLGALDFRNLTSKDFAVLLRNPFQLYIVFLMAGSVIYQILGGNFKAINTVDLLGYVSTVGEGFGLLSLRHKIECKGSVAGISGMTVGMYALTYTLRLWELFPREGSLDQWVTEVLAVASLLLVLDILRFVFVTYRNTYQEDLDVLKMSYLVIGSLVMAGLVHPFFREGFAYSFSWTFGFYLDVMALMPQVVMMAKGSGKVEAPIAHFVAATTLSRLVDLWWWSVLGIDLGPQGYIHGVNYSGWLIVGVHILSLLLVIDFMYYYVKARFAGSGLSEDLAIPLDSMC